LFIQSRRLPFFNNLGVWGIEKQYFYSLILISLGLIFALTVFIRFMRARSLLTSLILTTVFTAAAFYFAAKFVTWGPFTGARTAATTGTTSAYTFSIGSSITVNLAQIGLFAIWLVIVALIMFFQIRPVKKIQVALETISSGVSCKKFKIGKSKQFRKIEEELAKISSAICQHQLKVAEKERAKQIAKERKRKNAKKF